VEELRSTFHKEIDEIRHEVFQKYGEAAYLSAHYGWHNGEIIDNKRKTYNLVDSNPVQCLVAIRNIYID